MSLSRALVLAAVLAAAAAGPLAAQEPVSVASAPVAVFEEMQPDQTRFGALRFIGGLQLDSLDRRFGGLSGIDISADGRRLLMVSDIGNLFAGTIDYRDGVPVALSDVTVSRLIGEDGAPLGRKEQADAESLRAAGGRGLPDGIFVGFERDTRVLAYEVDGKGRTVKARRLALPDAVAALPYNRGLEGIAVLPPTAPDDGGIVVFSESAPDAGPAVIPGWLVTRSKVREIGLKRIGDYDLTDIVALPNGDLIALERRFNMFLGVGMRLRYLTAAELAGDQPMTGTELFAGGMAYSIDNMEGLAVHRDDAGRTILTIVSDDNFSTLQRTLILQFELL